MPHINRIRVNNVKYNFGTQYYDDFLMRFSCKNTIYDLANGGGKSVLMLLLLQNLIPNCTLDEKQPIEKLFRTADGSKTIHSLIEWRLSDIHVHNNYKYMLTGFCARKAKDDNGQESIEETMAPVKENASIEYFNYVIFYREFNDNDIKNLPLSNGKERITYNGLKAYLRDLERKDLSLEIKIFERKGDYQRFIAQYGLYESEWEIIRGINKTEGHVRTYFETNYKTTRKVVEDLLIEEIIQKSFASQTDSDGENDYMAKTLLDIKDKLLELADKKEDILSYDRQIEVIDGFASRVQSVKQLYFGREDITADIAKCHHGLKAMIAGNEGKREELQLREEALLSARSEADRHIESAGIQSKELEASKLSYEVENLINEQALSTVEWKSMNEELTLKESINDYADYVYYKTERDATRELIEASLKDKGQILSDITELTGQVYENIKKKREYIQSQIEKEEKICDMENALAAELQDAVNKNNSSVAVMEYLMDDIAKKEQDINTHIGSLRGELELYLSTDIRAEYNQCRAKADDIEAKLEANVKARETLSSKETELDYAMKDVMVKLEEAENELSENMQQRRKYTELSERVTKLMEIYGESNITALTTEIKNRSREAYLEEETLNRSLVEKKAYYEQLKNGYPIGASEEIQKVYEYIERFYGDIAIMGIDYLKKCDTADRGIILERIPVLPYCIIIRKNYQKVITDAGIKGLDIGNYAVPLVAVEALDKRSNLIDNVNLVYVMKDSALYTDEKALEKELRKTEKDIEDIQFRLERVAGKSQVLEQDYDFAKEYESVYMKEAVAVVEASERIRYTLKELESNKASILSELEEIQKKVTEFADTDNLLTESLSEVTTRLDKFTKLLELMEESRILSRKLDETNVNYKKTLKEKGDVEARLEASIKQNGERTKHIEKLKNEMSALEQNWNTYKKYYKEGVYPASTLTETEQESRLKGLIRALESEATDISDKQKLVENYDIAMEKSLQAIDYKGIFLDDIKAKYESLEVAETSKDELKALKHRIEQIKTKIDGLAVNISRLRSRKDRLEGAITHGKVAMEEKYGQYVVADIPNGDFEAFIEDKKQSSAAITLELEKVKQEISIIEKNEGRFAVLEKDLQKVIDKANINVSAYNVDTNEIQSYEDFQERISDVLEKYDKYVKDMNDRRQEFEHDRQLLADTLRKLGAEPLSDEIKRNSTMPANVAETDELMEALKEICKCLSLEKDRVGKSIEDMERIKDNFENQCIQTCVNIRNELDRLPKQSKINMDDETISIISLAIPYVKEDVYKQRMSQYIDETTRMADEMKSESERIKYIRGRLAWKKLFSVIVTDMNAIKLNLYKRERIKEQSRYLRYEEAVGSTGQSQGIYIQFLIAIINYIASINSKDKDTGLRKVIFIDNPFGAAKDIYIWEPIFKLLKTNNVQLVVPARGVTPAITGRFDVNYILGQKLVDGRAQTVVVDYSSHVDNEKMDYEKLEFEQTSLF